MADVVTLVHPGKLERNKDNPRLIFRQDDLDALQQSIADQGILVPLTVFKEGHGYRLLDGERRWRCAIKLGLSKIPVIVQPKPERLQNIMMMFAIHHARKDWDPLPTALKLQDLEDEFTKRNGRKPNEKQLAGLASLSRGEVRRLKKLLALPVSYRDDLLRELDKPRSQQVLTVDHVLEATTAASLLKKRGVVDDKMEDELRKAIIEKFRTNVVKNTVAPRKLARMARAVARDELPLANARQVIKKFIDSPSYDIDSAFRDTVEQVDFEHTVEQYVDRLESALEEHRRRRYNLPDALAKKLESLGSAIRRIVSQG
jgi:ParB family transcriptional regulator, chromosome partitioning protein